MLSVQEQTQAGEAWEERVENEAEDRAQSMSRGGVLSGTAWGGDP